MVSYLGAFPFPSHAPAILTNEALLKVVTVLTQRYGAVLKRKGKKMWLSEIYRSLAVYDRGLHASVASANQLEDSTAKFSSDEPHSKHSGQLGFTVDRPDDGDDNAEEDDDLVLSALESMDASEVFKHGEHLTSMHHSVIPSDNFLKLIELLLVIAPMDSLESIATYTAQIDEKRLQGLRKTANHILSSFNIEKTPGISFRTFDAVVSACTPYLFESLRPLFEHFLFTKDLDLHKRKPSSNSIQEPPPKESKPKEEPKKEPLLKQESDLLDLNVLSQLSFFIKGSSLFPHLRLLYSGNDAGFSMGSFEKAVINWRAPTILLVSGTLIPSTPSNPREKALLDSLSQRRLQGSVSPDSNHTITYGAYIPVQWKQTYKAPFGDNNTMLFQLAPTHDVFRASPLASEYAYFNRSPTRPPGVGFGSAVSSSALHSSTLALGPVSLHLDDSLEYAVFTHLSEGGGSFYPSPLPGRKGQDWQDRFEIEALEVWGLGGDDVAETQRKEWEFEHREAEARRRINLGTGDIEADRQLLEMAGLVGGGRSGGSMG
jgi:hypothetical protein